MLPILGHKLGTCVAFHCWCSLCHVFVCDQSLEVTGHSHSIQTQSRSGKKQESIPIFHGNIGGNHLQVKDEDLNDMKSEI